jgi:hypothetical protein
MTPNPEEDIIGMAEIMEKAELEVYCPGTFTGIS